MLSAALQAHVEDFLTRVAPGGSLPSYVVQASATEALILLAMVAREEKLAAAPRNGGGGLSAATNAPHRWVAKYTTGLADR